MTFNTLLSRKVILSVFLAIYATWALWTGLILESQWQWVMMATVVTYVAGASLQKKKDLSRLAPLRLWGERIKAIFTREFMIAFATVLLTSVLLQWHRIGADTWFAITTSIAGAYNIVNAASKNGN
jgi:hypothetical protein